jgi:molybdenum cofactor guanylyltransferase
MTAAVILTDRDRSKPVILSGKPAVTKLIYELSPHFKEIIIVTEKPSIYLPYVKDTVRLLSPFYKGMEPLSSLHASLSLTFSQNVWLLHENEGFPGYQFFAYLRTKQKKNNLNSVICHSRKGCLLYSLFNKKVLNILDEMLSSSDPSVPRFLDKINSITCSS